MIALDKSLFYDWHGYNESIFKKVNAFHNETSDRVMVLISDMADRQNFMYYVYALLAWCVCMFIIKKIRSDAGATQYICAWIGVFAVLLASFEVDGFIIQWLKAYFSYPRPYVVFGPEDVHLLLSRAPHNIDDFWSFPSGHAAFATVLVVSLWPVLSENMRWLGMCFIFMTWWSRMAMGMHFPMDVLTGTLIAAGITVFLRRIIYGILNALRIEC